MQRASVRVDLSGGRAVRRAGDGASRKRPRVASGAGTTRLAGPAAAAVACPQWCPAPPTWLCGNACAGGVHTARVVGARRGTPAAARRRSHAQYHSTGTHASGGGAGLACVARWGKMRWLAVVFPSSRFPARSDSGRLAQAPPTALDPDQAPSTALDPPARSRTSATVNSRPAGSRDGQKEESSTQANALDRSWEVGRRWRGAGPKIDARMAAVSRFASQCQPSLTTHPCNEASPGVSHGEDGSDAAYRVRMPQRPPLADRPALSGRPRGHSRWRNGAGRSGKGRQGAADGLPRLAAARYAARERGRGAAPLRGTPVATNREYLG